LLNGSAGNTCGVTNCHNPNTNHNASLTINMIEKGKSTPLTQYVSGKTYTITVQVSGSSSVKYGFSATLLDAARVKNGTTNGAGSGVKIVSFSSRSIAMHNAPSSTGTFTFDWTPPATLPKDSVIIYVAGNAADGNTDKPGDQIITQQKTLYLDKSANSFNSAATYFKLYPNPFGDKLTFTQIANNVRIYNLNAEKILDLNNVDSVNTNDLKPGIYFIEIDFDFIKIKQKISKI
jgi:hypothetical protein